MNLAWWSVDVSNLTLIFAFIVAMVLVQNRAKERRERLRVIEEAIRDGHMDPATRQDLVAELTGRRPPAPQTPANAQAGRRTRWVFGAGWLGMCLGGGLMMAGDRDAWEAGVVIIAIGFALVSLPLALREFERERGRARTSDRG